MSDFGAAIERAVFIVGLNAGVRKISAFSGTTNYATLIFYRLPCMTYRSPKTMGFPTRKAFRKPPCFFQW